MSRAEISDLQLDRLLGQVPSPDEPSPALAERIVAQAIRTPQGRPGFMPLARRHGPRRRVAVWSVLVAANLMAAAAAAASWDGDRFDLQRLADLPQRVMAAVRHSHHHEARHSTPSSMNPQVSPQIVTRNAPHAKAPAVKPDAHVVLPVIAPVAVPIRPNFPAVSDVHPSARARFQRQGLAPKPIKSFNTTLRSEEKSRRRVADSRVVEKTEPAPSRIPEHRANGPQVEVKDAEPIQQSARWVDRPEFSAPANGSARASEAVQGRSRAKNRPLERQSRVEEPWMGQIYKHKHPRGRVGRFPRRF